MKHVLIKETHINKLDKYIYSLQYLQRNTGKIMSSILQKQIDKFEEKIKILKNTTS